MWVGVYSQTYNIKTYSVNDGLPSSQIYDVHLDDRGMIWMATAFGLARFDGYDVETFDRTDGLRDEVIYDIFEDSDHNLWVSTETGGVGLFENDTLIYLKELSLLDSLTVQYMIESPSGELWFGTYEQGVIIWNREDSTFRAIGTDEGLADLTVWDIYFDKEGRGWIGTWYGVSIYEEGEGITRTIKKEDGLTGIGAYQVFEAKDGTMWIPTSNGVTLVKTDMSIDSLTVIDGKPLNYVFNVSQDEIGRMWIGTERQGLYWYDPDTGESTHITKKNGLSSNYIYRLVKAEDGTIWVATNGNGVNIFKDEKFKFYGMDSGFGFSAAYSLSQTSNGTIWIGTDNALVSFRNGSFTSYPLPENEFFEEEIWDIEELPDGNLLLLTYDYRILKFNGRTFKDFEFDEKLPSWYITDIEVEGDVIWMGAEDGLLKYENGSFEKIKPANGYWESNINTIFRDSRGIMWLGTESGLARYDGNEFKYYKQEHGLKGLSVFVIKEDAYGNIWAGTNQGLSVVIQSSENGVSEYIESFEVDDVYLKETLFIQFDDNGGLWQGTNRGVNYFNLEQWRETGEMNSIHFPLGNYGRGVEMNASASLRDDQGRLWFGTARKGLVVLDPGESGEIGYQPPPKVYIREVAAHGEVILDQMDYKETKPERSLDLKYNQNHLQIRFSAVDYMNPYRIQYRYRLSGFEEEWNQAIDIREVSYTNLPPGTYQFQVTAKSVKSDWNNQPTLLNVTVSKPFWKSGVFFIFTGLSLIALIVLYINIRVSTIEKNKLKQLVDIQTKDLVEALDEKEVLIKEVHHRVKNNLAVISGLFDLQMLKSDDKDVVKILKNSQLRIRSMSIIHEQLYQHDSLSKIGFSEYMENLLEVISTTIDTGETDIVVHSKIEPGIELTITQAVPCGLILNELLSNAYEHAFQGRSQGDIEVTVQQLEEDLLMLRVKDNGIGMDPVELNGSASSLGITLVKTLSTQLKGELNYTRDNGSTFEIKFQRDKAYVGFYERGEKKA